MQYKVWALIVHIPIPQAQFSTTKCIVFHNIANFMIYGGIENITELLSCNLVPEAKFIMAADPQVSYKALWKPRGLHLVLTYEMRKKMHQLLE